MTASRMAQLTALSEAKEVLGGNSAAEPTAAATQPTQSAQDLEVWC